ncbi:MAG: hypothetical protein C0418_04125 [Coriobacteriaceae bacterium]|nr:hypothetical protein [Coriobacteriaceae bacterium]
MNDTNHQRIRVLVETAERTIKGHVYKPVKGEGYRLSDHLNAYEKQFICLSDCEVTDRGQIHRVGDKRTFCAIAVNAISYITPLEED